MLLHSDTVLDEYNRGVLGASIYVYGIDGAYATLTSDGTTPLAQPVSTDEFGGYSYYADVGYYTEEVWYGGKRRSRTHNIAIGNPGSDLTMRSDLAAGAGAGLVGFLPSVTGAVLRTISSWLGDFAWPAGMFGAVGDGTTDDTVALQRPLTLGLKCRLKNSATYLISSGLSHATGGGFVCPDGWATIKAKTGVGGFNIKDVGGVAAALDRNMLVCSGTDDIVLRNIEFTTDGATPVVLHGVRLSGGMATKGYDLRVAFSGFFVGRMLAINSVGAGTRAVAEIVSARNSGTSQGNTYWTGGTPQMTVVEVDNDLISSQPSAKGNIRIGSISDILFTGNALANYDQQTDGVTFATHGAAATTSGWNVEIGTVDGVGEPIDCMANRNNFKIGTIKNAYNFAIKLIHGAQGNTIEVGTIEASGQAAVSIWGSDEADRDTSGNNVRVGTVKNPGSYGIGLTKPANSVAAVLFSNSNSTRKPVQNTVHIDNVIGDGVNMDVVVLDGGTSANNGNTVSIGKASGWLTATVSAPPSNVRVRYLGRSFTEMTMSGGQAIASATTTKLAFDTVATDLEGIGVTASNKITVKWPGLYRLQVQVLMSNWAVGSNDQWTLEIRKNTTVMSRVKDRLDFTGKDEVGLVTKDIYVAEDELVSTGVADITAWITQDTGASKTVSNTAYQTFLTVARGA